MKPDCRVYLQFWDNHIVNGKSELIQSGIGYLCRHKTTPVAAYVCLLNKKREYTVISLSPDNRINFESAKSYNNIYVTLDGFGRNCHYGDIVGWSIDKIIDAIKTCFKKNKLSLDKVKEISCEQCYAAKGLELSFTNDKQLENVFIYRLGKELKKIGMTPLIIGYCGQVYTVSNSTNDHEFWDTFYGGQESELSSYLISRYEESQDYSLAINRLKTLLRENKGKPGKLKKTKLFTYPKKENNENFHEIQRKIMANKKKISKKMESTNWEECNLKPGEIIIGIGNVRYASDLTRSFFRRVIQFENNQNTCNIIYH